MAKIIGILLIVSSIISLILGGMIDSGYGTKPQLSGNVVADILAQKPIAAGFFDYFEATLVSYSITSFIIGTVLFLRF